MTVLLLGGTAEARQLAAELVAAGCPLISSLAGRVRDPALPVGRVRIGGFGGTDGLVDFLAAAPIEAVVDATHPFAATMSRHAAEACRRSGTPLIRLARPGWSAHPLASTWTWVPDLAAAASTAAWSRRPLLTTGRQSLPAFAGWHDRDVCVRLVDPPSDLLPARWRIVVARGPYTLAGERELIRSHQADLLLTKDSGGAFTAAKLTAAGALGVPVVVVARPPSVPGVRSVDDVGAARDWALERCGTIGA